MSPIIEILCARDFIFIAISTVEPRTYKLRNLTKFESICCYSRLGMCCGSIRIFSCWIWTRNVKKFNSGNSKKLGDTFLNDQKSYIVLKFYTSKFFLYFWKLNSSENSHYLVQKEISQSFTLLRYCTMKRWRTLKESRTHQQNRAIHSHEPRPYTCMIHPQGVV